MKAMILAAGVGSRLRPLTDEVPKALVEVGGMPMLEAVARRLQAAKVTELIVNVHHHAEKVVRFCEPLSKRLRLPIAVSREDDLLLDTGGGIKNAEWFFDPGQSFLVHNADVLSDVDLRALWTAHAKSGALATLAVMERPSKRLLAFSPDGRLLGRAAEGQPGLAFCGIYALSSRLFPLMTETGVFAITDALVRLAAAGEKILAFRHGGYWADIGDARKLEAARERARREGLPA